MGAIAIGVAGTMVPVLNSCSSAPATLVAPPVIPGATFVGNKACAECHSAITRSFPTSGHARIHLEDARAAGQTGCESCHGAGSLHIAGGGGKGKFIINPGKDPATCFECHRQEQGEFQLPQHHPVLEKKMNCAQCHDPHGSDVFKPAGGWQWRAGTKPVRNVTESRPGPLYLSIRRCGRAARSVIIRTAASTPSC